MNNNNLRQACILAQSSVMEQFEKLESENEEHIFSKKFERKMNRLIDKMRNDKYHHLTRRATRIIVIAAIIFALTITAFASPLTRDYILQKFDSFTRYSVEDAYEGEIDDLVVGYIPDGFELSYEYSNKNQINKEYFYNDYIYNVYKSNESGFFELDTEYNEETIKKINGIDYIICTDNSLVYNGLIWNYGDYSYYISGNISIDLMIKIAERIN